MVRTPKFTRISRKRKIGLGFTLLAFLLVCCLWFVSNSTVTRIGSPVCIIEIANGRVSVLLQVVEKLAGKPGELEMLWAPDEFVFMTSIVGVDIECARLARFNALSQSKYSSLPMIYRFIYVRDSQLIRAKYLVWPFWLLSALLGIVCAGIALPLVRWNAAPLLCKVCGYNLTGNSRGTCTECNTPVTEKQRELLHLDSSTQSRQIPASD
ncbi:hypothetical protein RAS2_30310 [Phycisphaerae bacterium RAS2]|nr:hypothetical protein RAS2_30310 [Phycisphaerae bacterium RAS2]